MKQKNTTKRTLALSLLVMLMCVAMLVGTTFAWFTDSASTGVNKIKAGNLDVQLLMYDGTDYVDISNDTRSIFGTGSIAQNNNAETLWEPGKTQVAYLAIKNSGNLALKYKVELNVTNVSKDMYKAMKYAIIPDAQPSSVTSWTDGSTVVAGTQPVSNDVSLPVETTHYFALAIHMNEDAGNEYQGGEVDFDLTVVATQDTVENDSFDNQYDANAGYPVVVADEAALRQALANGKDVRLGSDIVLTSAVTFNGDVDVIGDGNSIISSKEVYVAPTANVNFKNVNFANPVWDNNKASSVYASGLEGKVVFDGCTFTNPQWECIQITPKDGAEIIVTNCTFVVDGNGTYAHGTKVERMLHIQNTAASGNYTAVITNNNFIGVDLCRNAVIDVDDIAAFANVTCGGNTFAKHDNTHVSTMADGMIYVNINGLYDAASVATNTYAQFTQTPAAALHH